MLAPQLDALESEVFVGDADAFAMQLSDGDPATVCCILLVKTCRDPRRSKTDLRPDPGAEARAANLNWSSWSTPTVLSAWRWAGLMVPPTAAGSPLF